MHEDSDAANMPASAAFLLLDLPKQSFDFFWYRDASRAERFPIVLPSGGSTSSSRSPRSSSLASGVVKVAESVTGSGCLRPFSLLPLGFARYAVGALLLVSQ